MNFIEQVISGGDKASHKRFIAMYTAIVLLTITCAVVWYKGTANDNIYLAGALIGLITALAGASVYQAVKKKKVEQKTTVDDSEFN